MSSSEPDSSTLVYDWNTAEDDGLPRRSRPIKLYDESLRDGLQSPSVLDPPIDQKIEMLHLMDRLGIAWADIGLPGAGPRAVEDVRLLAQEIPCVSILCATRKLNLIQVNSANSISCIPKYGMIASH